MHARSALFDVYGDHLRTRGNEAPVATLLRLLEPVGIAAPAVRTAISRMVLQGWLAPATLTAGRGYAATEQAIQRLDSAAERIYRTTRRDWDGCWYLVFLDPIPQRADRTRVRGGLTWLGYAELSEGVWLSPWPQPELDAMLRREKATASRATATDFDPATMPATCWDLAALGAEYAEWLGRVRTVGDGEDQHDPDRTAFARRFQLVHEWRKFLFRDPGLPDELLPAAWPGREAAAHFTAEAERLKPGADRFVDRCLA